jgi:hypothetical protein
MEAEMYLLVSMYFQFEECGEKSGLKAYEGLKSV